MCQNYIVPGSGSAVPTCPASRQKKATPEPLLTPLKEEPTSGSSSLLRSLGSSLQARGHSVTHSGCPWCLDKNYFKIGRISYIISSLYAKQGDENSPWSLRCCRAGGDSTDGASLLTFCVLRSFLGLGELHLAVKVTVQTGHWAKRSG